MAWRRETNQKGSFSSNWRDKSNKEENDIPQWRRASSSRFFNKEKRIFKTRSFFHDSIDFTNIIYLKKILNTSDPNEILTMISNNIETYRNIFINKLDYEVLTAITQLNQTVCSSSLIAKKYHVLQTTINEDFIKLWNTSISTKILYLEFSSSCKELELDWYTLITLFEECLSLIPSVAWQLIQKTIKLLQINISLIENEKDVSFSSVFKEKLVYLIQKTDKLENTFLRKNKKTIDRKESEPEPDDDYRIISIFPELRELVSTERNITRKNIVTGSYKDLAHYLDVQFRLLREDFLNPIREDVRDYLQNVDRKYFNIKVFEKIMFIEKTSNKDHFCYKLKFDTNKKVQNQIKKWLIPGTLLIFSNNEFETIFKGVVVDCTYLTSGLLLVSFEDTEPNIGTIYKMIECTIFFEPYYHVLKLIQILSQNSLSMSKYIINVDTCVTSPVFTNHIFNYYSEYGWHGQKLEEIYENKYRFVSEYAVIDVDGLNESQKIAYDAAFSKEFVIIQGPPGTGKTYLGLEITKSFLLQRRHNGPILIVCYTNHALDQFLEGLIDSTDRVVRFGSQSKNDKIMENTLYNRKKELDNIEKWLDDNDDDDYERERCVYPCGKRRNCKIALDDINKNLKKIDSLISKIKNCEGIICFRLIKKYINLKNSPFERFENEDFLFWLLQQHPNKDSSADFKDINMFLEYFDNEINYKGKRRLMENETYMGIKIYTIDINTMEFAITFIGHELKKIRKEKQELKGDDPEYVDIILDYDAYIEYLEACSRTINEKLIFLKACLDQEYNQDFIDIENENPFEMHYENRWQTYKRWLKRTEQKLNEKKDCLLVEYRNIYGRFKIEDDNVTVAVLKKMAIIGMTTTCAARMHGVLEQVGCQTVIVEEAAEVLEAHILPILTKHCRQVILLGDHKQLKPSTSDYILNKDFKHGISLFERMVNNGIQCHTLNVQHRMRPDISALISPAIYPELENNQNVYNYPSISGISHSLFFINHEHPEESFGDSSKFNIFEAKYLIKLAEYLINVGYSYEKITILAAYLGQVATIQKEANYSSIPDIKITAVDNFQGEENEIILLSLVRNNVSQNVGFLSIENRICVALSRAREGLFIMGNMNMLCQANKVWESVKDNLTSQEAIGPCLPLKCMHGCVTTFIKTPEDFQKAGYSGCEKDCEEDLDCGHKCQQKCHLDDVLYHCRYKCLVPCLRRICDEPMHEEICNKSCWEKCNKCCQKVSVPLLCGHDKKMDCYILKSSDFGKIECNEIVTMALPCGHDKNLNCCSITNLKNIQCTYNEVIDLACGHTVEISCQITKEKVKCSQNCETELLCGHKCMLKCHINNDPDHKNYICPVVCEKINLNCSRYSNKHTSLLKCGSDSKICEEKVKKFRRECKHCFPEIECYINVKATHCTRPCNKTLPCTHKCTNLCSDICGPCLKEISIRSLCGHRNIIKCERTEQKCYKNCLKKFECGHKCPKQCYEICSELCSTNDCRLVDNISSS